MQYDNQSELLCGSAKQCGRKPAAWKIPVFLAAGTWMTSFKYFETALYVADNEKQCEKRLPEPIHYGTLDSPHQHCETEKNSTMKHCSRKN